MIPVFPTIHSCVFFVHLNRTHSRSLLELTLTGLKLNPLSVLMCLFLYQDRAMTHLRKSAHPLSHTASLACEAIKASPRPSWPGLSEGEGSRLLLPDVFYFQMTRRASADEQVKCLVLCVLLCMLCLAWAWKVKLRIQSVGVGAWWNGTVAHAGQPQRQRAAWEGRRDDLALYL